MESLYAIDISNYCEQSLSTIAVSNHCVQSLYAFIPCNNCEHSFWTTVVNTRYYQSLRTVIVSTQWRRGLSNNILNNAIFEIWIQNALHWMPIRVHGRQGMQHNIHMSYLIDPLGLKEVDIFSQELLTYLCNFHKNFSNYPGFSKPRAYLKCHL